MPVEKCGKCNTDVQPRDIIRCTDCNSVFHIVCSTKLGVESGKRVSTRTTFKCEACASEASSVSSRLGQDRDIATVLDAIENMRKENAESFVAVRKENSEFWSKTQEKLNKVDIDITTLSTSLGSINQEIAEIKSNVSQNTANITQLEEENLTLREKVGVLQSELLDLQQYSRIDNIIITGVPLTKGEDVYSILVDIAKALKIHYNSYDVSVAHRLSSRIIQGRPPAIVVKFTSRSIKAAWMYARKNKGSFKANEIHNRFPDSTVHFNEHMTAHTRDIFNAGRQLVRDKKLAFVWVSDGRVLAKHTQMGKTVRVMSVEAMKRLPMTAPQPTQSPQPSGPKMTTPGSAPTAAGVTATDHTAS